MPRPQPHDQAHDEWLSTSQVAQRLGVSRRTVQRMDARGDLSPAYRLPSGHRRYRLSEVDALLQPVERSA